ncbi:hypothetical protein H7I41_12175 [Mycobacterium manitobense]|uniref:Uncharacterized protein n=1 Tax=[Mycobacterium] manitobense TaxID=190147 RepID=A0A9X3BWP7_9MYCO|nr:cadherin-like domain-containing protein [[Mycobacterium] manitobense]MCV7170672.1 hypothetical protein [[Mycobacterium] manitobense]
MSSSTTTADTATGDLSQSGAPKTVSTVRAQFGSLTAATTAAEESKTVAIAAPTAVTKTGFGVLSALTLRVGATGAPVAPVESPAVWVALAAARRELGSLDTVKIANTAESLQTTGELLPEADVSAAVDNGAPTITRTTVGRPSSTTGVVKGSVTATDPEKNPLTYAVTPTSSKGGTVVVDTKGKFTYTPTTAMRHAAALTTATPVDKTDTFTLSVADDQGNVTQQVVTVAIAPANIKPTAPGAAAGQPNSTTGVVIGTAWATDADKDAIILGGPTATKKGTIEYDNTTGTFRYTPTAEARAAANAPKASAAVKTDKFTITLSDGHGGTVTTSVTVNLANVDQNTFPGVSSGKVLTGTTGTKFEFVNALNGSASGRTSPTRVIVINPDGTAAATVTITGVPDFKNGGLIAAPGGGAYFTTINGTKTQVSVISATGALTTSTAMAGAPSGPITVAPDGTGYLTVGQFNTTRKTTISVVQIRPNGQTIVTKLSGIATGGVSVASDGTAYQAYQDGTTTKVLAVAPDGSVKTLSAPAGQTVVGTAVGTGGTAYLTTRNQTAGTTSVYTIDAGALSAPRVLTGNAVGAVAVAPDGTAYQVTTTGSTASISVITPTGAVQGPAIDYLPGYNGKFTTLQFADDGTGYLLVSNASGGAVVVVRPGGNDAPAAIPVPLDEIKTLKVGPDGRLFVNTTHTVSSTGAVTALPGSAGTEDLEFGPDGTPYAAYVTSTGIGFVNLNTGVRSAEIPGATAPSNFNGSLGDGFDPLTIGPDGTIFVRSYAGVPEQGTRQVSVLVASADGTNVVSFTDDGYGVWLTPTGDGGGYATVYDADTRTTKVWRVNATTGEKTIIHTIANGVATGGVDVRADGSLSVTTIDGSRPSNVTTTLHEFAG